MWNFNLRVITMKLLIIIVKITFAVHFQIWSEWNLNDFSLAFQGKNKTIKDDFVLSQFQVQPCFSDHTFLRFLCVVELARCSHAVHSAWHQNNHWKKNSLLFTFINKNTFLKGWSKNDVIYWKTIVQLGIFCFKNVIFHNISNMQSIQNMSTLCTFK
jgi:hypothetical protein